MFTSIINQQTELTNVYIVNLKYLIGWKSIKFDELEETNTDTILGVFRSKENAYLISIEYNKNLLNNITEYSSKPSNLNINYFDSDINLFDQYNNLIRIIESKRLENKDMKQYAIVSEFEVK